jgi:hypothetical protein
MEQLVVPTLSGEDVVSTVGQTALKANNASITKLALGNDGIIYTIDQVLIPPSMQMPTLTHPPTAPGFSTIQKNIRMGCLPARECLEVHGDGDKEDSVRLGTYLIRYKVKSGVYLRWDVYSSAWLVTL